MLISYSILYHIEFNQIIQERKRADGYKVKAQDAQRRGKALSDTALAAAASSYGIDYMSVPGLKL